MPRKVKNPNHRSALARLSSFLVLIVGTAAAQDSPFAAQSGPLETLPIPSWRFGGALSFSMPATVRWYASDTSAGDAVSPEASAVRFEKVRRITLEQVKQEHLVAPATGPAARLGQLSVEAARQHRLGVEADYFPKISATAANLHFSEFLGSVLTVNRPLMGESSARFRCRC